MKISFKNDYSEGCHPNILEALIINNTSQQEGYGLDEFSLKATELILKKCSSPDSAVHLVSGGTQANLIVIAALLKPHESVIAANTGHIFNNEAGAIEATGHKISTAESTDGKLRPEQIKKILDDHSRPPHQLKPRLVYISNATELGTIYTKSELEALYQCCQEHDLYLFMDGARLAQAMMASNNDLSWADVAKYTDVFYLGGTKNGALLGEAIVINNTRLQEDFAFHVKQKGAMLSKGRLLGLQFQALLENDLFLDLAKHANQEAMKIKEAFKRLGCSFLIETFTNQIFPILSQEQIKALSEGFEFYTWHKIDEENAAVRIITSWASKESIVDVFVDAIHALKK